MREIGGELRGFYDRAMGNFLARRVTNDDVRAGIVSRMQPEIVRFRDFESEVVVIAGRAPDENLVTVR